MNVRITCPHCGFATQIARERIPEKARFATCPRCTRRFPLVLDSGTLETPPRIDVPPLSVPEPSPEADPAPAGRIPCPWERRAELGLWQGIHRTFREVLFSPVSFFRTLRFGHGYRDPIAFGLLFGSLGMMLSLFWDFFFAMAGFGGGLSAIPFPVDTAFIFPALLISSPVIVFILLFVVTGITHLFLRIVRGGGHGFEATFRVVAYGQATQIFGAIPFLGGVLASLWLMVVEVIGLKEMHETSYLRVILAFALPLILIVILALAVLIPLTLSLLR